MHKFARESGAHEANKKDEDMGVTQEDKFAATKAEVCPRRPHGLARTAFTISTCSSKALEAEPAKAASEKSVMKERPLIAPVLSATQSRSEG